MFVGIMPLLPLLIVSIFSQDLLVTIEKPLYRLSGLFPIFLFVLGPIVSYVSIAATSSSANITPTKEIALRAEEIWHQETGRPLRLVGGMNWLENVTAFYSADNPHTFIEMNLSRSQWIKRDNIAAYGLLVICEANDIECFARGKRLTTSAAVFKDVTVAHHAWWRVGRDYNFRLIIIPPVDSKNLSWMPKKYNVKENCRKQYVFYFGAFSE